MIPTRRAHGAKHNSALEELPARDDESRKHALDARSKRARAGRAAARETNLAWLERAKATGGLVLLGGSTLAHFRVRVAQSHIRRDLMPSFWSVAGIIVRPGRLATVPFEDIPDAGTITMNNGIVDVPLKRFDDPEEWPNIAVLQFANGVTADDVDSVRHDRGMIDIPSLMVRWLAFAWGADVAGNPLLEGQGVPSAAFVGSAYSMARIDLTPGLASASACPEAIWQSAKWWREFYEKTAGSSSKADKAAAAPAGKYVVRQPAAAIIE